MKAILINPFGCTVTEVQTDESVASLQNIYALTQCSIVEALGIGSGNDAIFVDEEGLLRDLASQAFFLYTDEDAAVHVLAGRGLVLGCDDEGNSIAPEIKLDEVQDRIHWLSPVNPA